MNRTLAPITITPEQIIAAAQKIAAAAPNDASEYGATSIRIATEHWLRVVIDRILNDPDHYALGENHIGNFAFDPDCANARCRRVPMAHDIYCKFHRDLEDGYNSDLASAPFAPRPELVTNEHGDQIYLP